MIPSENQAHVKTRQVGRSTPSIKPCHNRHSEYDRSKVHGMLYLHQGMIPKHELRKLWQIFTDLDDDCDGKVDMNELEHHLLAAYYAPRQRRSSQGSQQLTHDNVSKDSEDDFSIVGNDMMHSEIHIRMRKYNNRPLIFQNFMHILYPHATHEDLDLMYTTVCPAEVELRKEQRQLSDAMKKHAEEQEKDMEALFELYDEEGNDKLSFDKLEQLLKYIGLSEKEAGGYLDDLVESSEGDNHITKNEFVDWFVHGQTETNEQ